jgi:hypothetical protein
MVAWIGDLIEFLVAAVAPIFEPSKNSSEEANEKLYMPLVQIEDLPDSARTWVFGADHDLDESATDLLLRDVDRFLSQWHAHGAPLTAARDWKYGRFLTIGVDQSTAGASGCSIDGLFRSLKALEPRLGASLVTSGLIFYRDGKGRIQAVNRDRFTELSVEGKIGPETQVFDPTVTTMREWRARFQLNASDSWHAKLLGKNQPA